MSVAKWGRRPERKPAGRDRTVNELDAFVRAKSGIKRLNANIPAALHARVKAGCALEGRGMTEVLIELLEQRFPSGR